MDLTGRFPYKFSRGNEYILIAYHVNSSAILGQAIKNKQALTIAKSRKQIHNTINQTSAAPNSWILDNETSHHLQHVMRKNSIPFQLVHPHNHRANLAERAIQTFKNHFKTGQSTVHPSFPIVEWDRLLLKAFITLNLLRPANANPKLSAYSYIYGNYDFNKTPMTPSGSKIVIDQKPSQSASWGLNGNWVFILDKH